MCVGYVITVGVLFYTLCAVALSVVGGDCIYEPNTIVCSCKKKAIPVQACYNPTGFQEVGAPRFSDSRHMKVVRLSAIRTGRLQSQEILLVLISERC